MRAFQLFTGANKVVLRVLTALNQIFAEQGVNIAAQYLQTSAQVGYVVIDIEADEDVAEKALQAMKALPGTIRARLLY